MQVAQDLYLSCVRCKIHQNVDIFFLHTQAKQKMSSNIILPQLFLPRTAIDIGRLVASRSEPHRAFHDPKLDVMSYVSYKTQTGYSSVDNESKNREVSTRLTAFLSSAHSRHARTSVSISSELVRVYFLQNSLEWFRKAVELEETRRWIEQTIDDGEDVYLVVGYYTVTDALVVEQVRNQTGTSGQAVLPLSNALIAAGIPLLFDNIVDPGVSLSHEAESGFGRRYVAQGEQICAVQYRKLRFGWLSSKNLNSATLAKEGRWKRYDKPRGDDDEDILEVGLDDGQDIEGVSEECLLEPGETIVMIDQIQ